VETGQLEMAVTPENVDMCNLQESDEEQETNDGYRDNDVNDDTDVTIELGPAFRYERHTLQLAVKSLNNLI